jgi:hypothetical protein
LSLAAVGEDHEVVDILPLGPDYEALKALDVVSASTGKPTPLLSLWDVSI